MIWLSEAAQGHDDTMCSTLQAPLAFYHEMHGLKQLLLAMQACQVPISCKCLKSSVCGHHAAASSSWCDWRYAMDVFTWHAFAIGHQLAGFLLMA